MDSAKLIKAREYYDKVASGEDKKSAALAVYGKRSPKSIEQTPEYLAIISAVNQLQKEELRKDIEAIKRKQIKTYSDLLDKGSELIDEASSVQEKIAAQANQRANLSTGVVESAIDWSGENRNQDDLGDVLEGVIL